MATLFYVPAASIDRGANLVELSLTLNLYHNCEVCNGDQIYVPDPRPEGAKDVFMWLCGLGGRFMHTAP